MIINIAITALALSALSSVADAQARPGDGCASVMSEATCTGYNGCRWFLGACTDKPLVNCWQSGPTKPQCNKIPGCRWFADPVEYVPPESDKIVNAIQCRDQTVCEVFVSPKDCNSKSWCAWVDGKCQTYGTEPTDDWFPKCWNVGTYRQTCKFQSPKCKWFTFQNDDGLVVYGCRHVEFCGFDKGGNVEEQCRKSKYCQYKNGKCTRNPTQSPTASPSQSPSKSPTAAPTKPTKSPTIAPTTKGPTKKPTTRSPTIKPTTGFPTEKPTTAFPTTSG